MSVTVGTIILKSKTNILLIFNMQRICILLLLFSFGCGQKKAHNKLPAEFPNIIYILADDLGYGDIGLYGQKKFSTPHIDALGISGIKFNRHYSGSTVCAPSRSALMTGYHTGHTPIRGNKEIRPEGQHPLADSVYTLAEMLKEKGYTTGAFGKWGLGYPGSEGDPLNQGFDTFYGYNCQRLAHNYYPHYLWSDDRKITLMENRDSLTGTYAPLLIQEQLLKFIEANRDRPFFAFVPSVVPHAELAVPEEYLALFRDKFLPEKTYEGCDPGCRNFKTGGYASQLEAHAAFAGMVHLLDIQVSEIVRFIESLGLRENTVIIFTSDNGPHLEGGADPDYFDSNGPLKGYKRDLYEGGIRVPMLVSWPGHFKQGRSTDHVSAFWDIFATLNHLTGGDEVYGDGISFLPELMGQEQTAHEFLYWEFPEKWATPAQALIIDEKWKAIRRRQEGRWLDIELYNLDIDPGEMNNISVEYPEILARAEQLLTDQHNRSVIEDWWLEGIDDTK